MRYALFFIGLLAGCDGAEGPAAEVEGGGARLDGAAVELDEGPLGDATWDAALAADAAPPGAAPPDAAPLDAMPPDAVPPDAALADAAPDAASARDAAPGRGQDTDQPFPLDRGGAPGAPATYLGLPLRQVERPDPGVTPVDGRIGVVCVGMSNATQECSHYIGALRTRFAGRVNPQVTVVDCAVGGHAIERWIDPADDARLWTACVQEKIPAAGLRVDQVRVVYHKAANQLPYADGATYPTPGSDYFTFIDHLGVFAGRVRGFLPAVQAVYTSSRSYGGFTDRAERGEPRSFEEGMALNAWLAEHPVVDGVWHGWGPYLWAPPCASGETNGGGICYDRADFQADGIHPAQGAREKIAGLIDARFREHAWYPGEGTAGGGGCAAACNDGDPCTRDRCVDGMCVSEEFPDCRSEQPCMGQGPDPSCDDGNACTRDGCRNGVCVHPPIAGCENPP